MKKTMNEHKILIGINIILLFSLFACLFFLTKKSSEKDPIKDTLIELLDGMIKKTQDDVSTNFKYYEKFHSYIKEDIDSFHVLMDQKNIFCSSQLLNFYNKKHLKSNETDIFLNMFCSIKDKQSQDFILMSKFMEYDFLKKVIESYYLNFHWFDQIAVRVLSQKDTIQLGEENIVEFGYLGMCTNSEQQPIVVMDKDTIIANYGVCIFKEKPQKRGLVTHEGYMTGFQPREGIIDLKFRFNYYVK